METDYHVLKVTSTHNCGQLFLMMPLFVFMKSRVRVGRDSTQAFLLLIVELCE